MPLADSPAAKHSSQAFMNNRSIFGLLLNEFLPTHTNLLGGMYSKRNYSSDYDQGLSAKVHPARERIHSEDVSSLVLHM